MMLKKSASSEALLTENRELRARLAEVEQTLEAIRTGGVDALVVSVNNANRIFTLPSEEHNYRTMIEVMQQGALALTCEGTILYANRGFANMLKAPLEKVIGSDISDWIAPQSQALLKELLRLDLGDRHDSELLLSGPGGAQVPALLSAGKQHMNGRPDQLWMVATDLSEVIERKKKEEELLVQQVADEAKVKADGKLAESLRRSAEYTRSLIEASLDPLVTISTEGKITDVNEASAKITGRTRAELIGTDFSAYFTDPEAARKGHERVFAEGFVQDYPLSIRRADGHVTDVLYNASLYRDEQGRVQGAFAAARDITARKRAEAEILKLNAELEKRVEERTKALAASQERLRLAAEAADIGFWDWDLESNTVRWDKLMFSIYGMPPSDDGLIRYKDWTCHVHPDDVAEQEASLRDTIVKAGRNQREFRIIRDSDDKTRTIRASDAAIRGEGGKATHVVGINLDVTETFERLEEIRKLNASLKNRAAELETSVKELDAFSYSVSHDLRAPLRAIDGFSRIVEEDYAPKLDNEGRRLIGVIRGEAQRMGRLIDDLLTFSRLGRQKVESGRIDVEAMARKVFEELTAVEPGRVIHLDLHPIPPAFGTEAMIRQVWVNLIGNAVKFTGRRERAEIEIGVEPGEAGEQVYFVRDNGAGFDMRYADKLFGVFQRLHTHEEFPGTGVGLALVQRIVHRHGGRIWGEGEVEKGATFRFTIPDPGKEPADGQQPPPTQTL
jgi:PAS domain S-box-containing protein